MWNSSTHCEKTRMNDNRKMTSKNACDYKFIWAKYEINIRGEFFVN
jgi:hypothetical protein